jgi:hypothetical protein
MDTNSNEPVKVVPKCECGQSASMVMAFRYSPRVLCRGCYDKKSLRFSVTEQFLIDALEVIQRTAGLKPATLAALRELVVART